MLIKKRKQKNISDLSICFLLKDYNSNKKVSKGTLYFLQALEDLSGLHILVRHELEEAKNRDQKELAYEEISDIYHEWRQKKNLLNSANKMIEQLKILPEDLAVYYEQYKIQKQTISTINI